ncbi:MAG: hypothetical protein ACM3MI_10695, partial [Clostridiales bacterium]
ISQSFAQTKCQLNIGMDDSDPEIKNVIKLWNDYLNSKPDSLYNNPYWSNEEKDHYKRFDIVSQTYFTPSVYSLGYKPLILSIKRIKDYYEIKTAFYAYGQTSKKIGILATINVLAKKVNGEYRLFNALTENRKSLQKQSYGSITYYYPLDYEFNESKALEMKKFIEDFTKKFGFEQIAVDYYIGNDFDVAMKIVGFDNYLSMGGPFVPKGFSDTKNHIILSGGQGEYYPHEIVHQYINPLFENGHHVFIEGFASLCGGSLLGHPIPWHIKRLDKYLDEHPELNLNDLLEFYEMDSYTNPQYIYGAVLCDLAMKKGGFEEVKKLFAYGTEDKDFYLALEKEFGVKKEDLNKFIRSKIKELAGGLS